MSQDAQRRADEADRLINEPLLKQALKDLEARYLDELLTATPPIEHADKWRREMIDSINTVRGIESAIRSALMVAEAEMRTRGGRA